MGYRAEIDLDALETESEAAVDIATHDGSAAAHGGAEALAASALQPGDIVWTGEPIATELINSGDGDTTLFAQLTNTPSGPVICHYEGTTRVQGAGECFTISGKQITWLESVGGSGTAPPMAVGENLWFFYGSTGLALGTASALNITDLLIQPAAKYTVTGGTPVLQADGTVRTGITDDLDQLTFDSDWTVDADAGNRTIAASALGVNLKDTVGDWVSFGLSRPIPNRRVQIQIGVKFLSFADTNWLSVYIQDAAGAKVVYTALRYVGYWNYNGYNTATGTAAIAAASEFQLCLEYDPQSGQSLHHGRDAVYTSDGGWPSEIGSTWRPNTTRLTQTPVDEIIGPRVGIVGLGAGGAFEVLVRNLRVRSR